MSVAGIVNEVLDKAGVTEKEISQMPDINTAYPGFILSRDGQVYHLSDLYQVNALPGKIDDDGIVVPL